MSCRRWRWTGYRRAWRKPKPLCISLSAKITTVSFEAALAEGGVDQAQISFLVSALFRLLNGRPWAGSRSSARPRWWPPAFGLEHTGVFVRWSSGQPGRSILAVISTTPFSRGGASRDVGPEDHALAPCVRAPRGWRNTGPAPRPCDGTMDGLARAGNRMLLASIRARGFHLGFMDSGTWTAIWSPSKSALKAEQTSGCSWMALPSISTGSNAWMPRRCRVGARFSRTGCSG